MGVSIAYWKTTNGESAEQLDQACNSREAPVQSRLDLSKSTGSYTILHVSKGIMGALPKNKITRAERGKRRRGNRPTITKDPQTAPVPQHKKGFVAQMMRAVGISK